MNKKNYFIFTSLFVVFNMIISCGGKTNSSSGGKDTIVIHDTIELSKDDTITFNIPCKVMRYNMAKPGKALLIIWLHGGITVTPQWCSMLDGEDYFTWPKADNYIADYLQNSGEKAIFLLPICHNSETHPTKGWIDCAADLKHIIDCYVKNGVVDRRRIYLTGSSDGGKGVWDIAKLYPHYFAAIMPLSIPYSIELQDAVPTYWNTTSDEGDHSSDSEQLNAKYNFIKYWHHPKLKHGQDEEVLKSSDYIEKFLSNKLPQ